ncbi:uncharacterized protein LOC106669623 [Cimex lectularius]|uniref:Transmembrane protein 85 n=1 Tax=Cimex lectularius TaxID=79782 RepID=A0A8I6S2C7_CIMLE|nr:uncharacterized protein LOC106669623 [Cimex lectularius]
MKLRWIIVVAGFVCQIGCTSIRPNFRPQESSGDGKIQGEIVVSSSAISVKGPPKGFPLIKEQERKQRSVDEAERAVGRKKSGGWSKMMKKMWPYMLVPAMMSMGYAPFMLASLKMFVMNAVMINMMALNAAIFLTLRNMVFGPRNGEHIRYYNLGYKKKTHHHHHR